MTLNTDWRGATDLNVMNHLDSPSPRGPEHMWLQQLGLKARYGRLSASTINGLRKKWEFKYYRRRVRRHIGNLCNTTCELWRASKTLNGYFTSLFGWI